MHHVLSGVKIETFDLSLEVAWFQARRLDKRRWIADASVVGELAQMVERPLSMREVPGSMPGFSKSSAVFPSSPYALGKDPILHMA